MVAIIKDRGISMPGYQPQAENGCHNAEFLSESQRDALVAVAGAAARGETADVGSELGETAATIAAIVRPLSERVVSWCETERGVNNEADLVPKEKQALLREVVGEAVERIDAAYLDGCAVIAKQRDAALEMLLSSLPKLSASREQLIFDALLRANDAAARLLSKAVVQRDPAVFAVYLRHGSLIPSVAPMLKQAVSLWFRGSAHIEAAEAYFAGLRDLAELRVYHSTIRKGLHAIAGLPVSQDILSM
jgi:hypothetical protein